MKPTHSRTHALTHFRAGACVALLTLGACGGNPEGPPVRFTVPASSGLSAVTDTLAARKIIGSPGLFKIYARLQGADRKLKPGVYELQRGSSWGAVVAKLVSGDVVKTRLVVPEGWTLRQIAARMAAVSNLPEDSVLKVLMAEGAAQKYGVPGPTLEGYLYPATYQFPLGASPDRMVRELVRSYKQAWTPAMRERARQLGMSEREVVTLASIVEGEARVWSERPTISAVYHNRLKRGMRLQADPTVQYALEERRARLLHRDIASVADHPYNTYRRAGLPPGPIGSPSRGAIEAALNPAQADFLYFVARPNGTHVFTRTLAEHNAAARASRAEARALRAGGDPALRR